MDKEVKAQWVEALRSKKYKQGIGALHEYGGYCCLGVLCDILAPKEEGYIWLGADSFPPEQLLKKVGLPSAYEPKRHYDDLEDDNPVTLLANFNDEKGWKFPQIADWIEQNL